MRRSKSFYNILIVLCVFSLGVVACGGGPATADTSGVSKLEGLDPCTVVTQNDAAAFFGTDSGAGGSKPGKSTASCYYTSADKSLRLSVTLKYIPQLAVNADEYAQLKDVNQAVIGLGDGAFFDISTGQMTVARGLWLVLITGTTGTGQATIGDLSPVGQAALGRLP